MNPIKRVHAKITFKDSDGNEHVVTDNNVTQSKFDSRPGAINLYNISEGRLMQELTWYKEKFESAANDANESRKANNELMKDARALQAALDLICEVDNSYDSKTWDIAQLASAKFDKKYPQLNEKE